MRGEGPFAFGSGGGRMADGGWRMANDGWRMAGGSESDQSVRIHAWIAWPIASGLSS